jgi:phage terminase large subunit-like protein
MVNARVGKSARAEPVSALYEQRKVHHVGAFPELEDQLTSWVPGESDSPDRLDALVWAITFLALGPSGEGYNGRTIVHPANWAGRIR